MKPHERYDGARIALIALLHKHDDPEMTVSDLNANDRLFLTTTCCAIIIEHTLCVIAQHHEKPALEGLESLYQCMRMNIEAQCRQMQ